MASNCVFLESECGHVSRYGDFCREPSQHGSRFCTKHVKANSDRQFPEENLCRSRFYLITQRGRWCTQERAPESLFCMAHAGEPRADYPVGWPTSSCLQPDSISQNTAPATGGANRKTKRDHVTNPSLPNPHIRSEDEPGPNTFASSLPHVLLPLTSHLSLYHAVWSQSCQPQDSDQLGLLLDDYRIQTKIVEALLQMNRIATEKEEEITNHVRKSESQVRMLTDAIQTSRGSVEAMESRHQQEVARRIEQWETTINNLRQQAISLQLQKEQGDERNQAQRLELRESRQQIKFLESRLEVSATHLKQNEPHLETLERLRNDHGTLTEDNRSLTRQLNECLGENVQLRTIVYDIKNDYNKASDKCNSDKSRHDAEVLTLRTLNAQLETELRKVRAKLLRPAPLQLPKTHVVRNLAEFHISTPRPAPGGGTPKDPDFRKHSMGEATACDSRFPDLCLDDPHLDSMEVDSLLEGVVHGKSEQGSPLLSPSAIHSTIDLTLKV